MTQKLGEMFYDLGHQQHQPPSALFFGAGAEKTHDLMREVEITA